MKTARIIAYLSMLLMLSATVFYPKFLLIALLEDPYLPMGTIVAWFALVAVNMLPYLLSARLRTSKNLLYRILRTIAYLFAGLALFWGFISRLLAGNWNYTFRSKPDFVGSVLAGEVFEIFWQTLAIVPLAILLIIFIDVRLINRK
jgi:hypothetical protein